MSNVGCLTDIVLLDPGATSKAAAGQRQAQLDQMLLALEIQSIGGNLYEGPFVSRRRRLAALQGSSTRDHEEAHSQSPAADGADVHAEWHANVIACNSASATIGLRPTQR